MEIYQGILGKYKDGGGGSSYNKILIYGWMQASANHWKYKACALVSIGQKVDSTSLVHCLH